MQKLRSIAYTLKGASPIELFNKYVIGRERHLCCINQSRLS
jgi:hypothetical protein